MILVFALLWLIVATVIFDAFEEDIEKVENVKRRVISYIVLFMGAPVLFLAGVVGYVLEALGEEDE